MFGTLRDDEVSKNEDTAENNLVLPNNSHAKDSVNPLIMVFDTIGKHIMRTVIQASKKNSISGYQKSDENYYEKLQGKLAWFIKQFADPVEIIRCLQALVIKV